MTFSRTFSLLHFFRRSRRMRMTGLHLSTKMNVTILFVMIPSGWCVSTIRGRLLRVTSRRSRLRVLAMSTTLVLLLSSNLLNSRRPVMYFPRERYSPFRSRASIFAKAVFPVPGVPVTTIMRRFVAYCLLLANIPGLHALRVNTIHSTRLFQHSLFFSQHNSRRT